MYLILVIGIGVNQHLIGILRINIVKPTKEYQESRISTYLKFSQKKAIFDGMLTLISSTEPYLDALFGKNNNNNNNKKNKSSNYLVTRKAS